MGEELFMMLIRKIVENNRVYKIRIEISIV